jgi:hypothetical protein
MTYGKCLHVGLKRIENTNRSDDEFAFAVLWGKMTWHCILNYPQVKR